MLFLWWSMVIVSFACALVSYLLLEKPLMNIEKLVLTSLKH